MNKKINGSANGAAALLIVAIPSKGNNTIGKSAVTEMSIASVNHQTAIQVITANVARPANENATCWPAASTYSIGSHQKLNAANNGPANRPSNWIFGRQAEPLVLESTTTSIFYRLSKRFRTADNRQREFRRLQIHGKLRSRLGPQCKITIG